MVATRVRDEMHITCTHHVWQQHVSHTTGAYYAAKREAPAFYMESATIVGLYKRYQGHMCGLHEYENVRQRYTQQILGHALKWAQRSSIEACADQAMHDLYTRRHCVYSNNCMRTGSGQSGRFHD